MHLSWLKRSSIYGLATGKVSLVFTAMKRNGEQLPMWTCSIAGWGCESDMHCVEGVKGFSHAFLLYMDKLCVMHVYHHGFFQDFVRGAMVLRSYNRRGGSKDLTSRGQGGANVLLKGSEGGKCLKVLR